MSEIKSIQANMLPASFVTEYIKSANAQTGDNDGLFGGATVNANQKSYTKQDFINMGVPQDVIDMYFDPKPDESHGRSNLA